MNKIHCPICGCVESSVAFDAVDYLVTHEVFAVARCEECGFLFTNPQPAAADLGRYYESDEYVSHSESKQSMLNTLFLLARSYTLGWKVRLLKRYAKGRTLLDVGCGSASLLDASAKHRFAITGVEPSDYARAVAKKEHGLDILPIEELFMLKGSYSHITLFHVLEHVADLNAYFERFAQLLDTDGALVIALPNAASSDAAIYGAEWAAYDVPRHLWHFTKKDIVRLAAKYGFELADTVPMKLDAYYVSMLSERNVHGRNRWIRAVLNGWKSNWNACRRGGEYSSLVYVFIHKKEA